jgi:chromosome partitioning protein
MALVVSVAARKGGVGKSTCVMGLAGVLLAQKHSVLLVDTDSQATISQLCLHRQPIDNVDERQTVEALVRGKPASELMRPVPAMPGCSIIPARPDLHLDDPYVPLELATAPVDVVLIDTPGEARSAETMAAMLGSHAVLTPIVPAVLSLQSVPLMLEQLATAVAFNAKLTHIGWLLTQTEPRLKVQQWCEDQLRRVYHDQVMRATMPRLGAFQEAAVAGLPVGQFQPRGAAAKAMQSIWGECVRRIEKHKKGAA